MLTRESSARSFLSHASQETRKALGKMTIVRKLVAATAVAATLALLPISVLTNDNLNAGGVSGTTIGGATTNGGQGSWPFGK